MKKYLFFIILSVACVMQADPHAVRRRNQEVGAGDHPGEAALMPGYAPGGGVQGVDIDVYVPADDASMGHCIKGAAHGACAVGWMCAPCCVRSCGFNWYATIGTAPLVWYNATEQAKYAKDSCRRVRWRRLDD